MLNTNEHNINHGKHGLQSYGHDRHPHGKEHMTKDEITLLREKLGLSKADFSTRLGIHVSSLWNYETGKSRPSNLVKEKLEKAMYCLKSGKDIPHQF